MGAWLRLTVLACLLATVWSQYGAYQQQQQRQQYYPPGNGYQQQQPPQQQQLRPNPYAQRYPQGGQQQGYPPQQSGNSQQGQFFNPQGGAAHQQMAAQNVQQPGLLKTPVREKPNRYMANGTITAAAETGQATFYMKINRFNNPGMSMGNGIVCTTTCSYAFTIVLASQDAHVTYYSTEFVSFNRTLGTLSIGSWTDPINRGISTKPVSIDIFVHSLGFNIGQANGTDFFFRAPVNHVDTFVIDLRQYNPTGSGPRPTPVQQTLNGQESARTSIDVEYFVQCNSPYMGPSCELTCNADGNTPTVLCRSTIDNSQKVCNYTAGTAPQVSGCMTCHNGVVNGSCNLFMYRGETGVSYAFRTWTIVLACLLGLAIIIIIILVVVKIVTDSRNRRAQQFPQNRNPSAYSGGYRPNARPGTTPLLDSSQKDWEPERGQGGPSHNTVPAALRRPAPPAEVDSTQQSESFQENRPVATYAAARSRREAQV